MEFLEKRKKRKDNKSGFRGVYQGKNGRYRVSIGFRGKRIYLGMYDDFENAVEARLEAEKNIYGEFLELYHEWEKKSSDDPEWARRHPFFCIGAGAEVNMQGGQVLDNFIDMHVHILPGVDDGAEDIKEMEEMLKIAYSEGIRCIIATPTTIQDAEKNRRKC